MICGRCNKRKKTPNEYVCRWCKKEEQLTQWGRG